MTLTPQNRVLLRGTIMLALLALAMTSAAQPTERMVRIASIVVDSTKLQPYLAALRLQMTTAISTEPGVLSYHAVASRERPHHITILEVYADTAAYRTHIATPHFLRYKQTVENMVLSLQLLDVTEVGRLSKPGW